MMEISPNMLFGIMFIIGVVFSVYALGEAHAVKDCGLSAQNAMRGILVMGVAMTSIAFTALMCKCGHGNASSALGQVFVGGMMCLSIVTLVLISIIMSACKEASKGVTTAMLVLCIIAILISGGYIGYEVYHHHMGSPVKSAMRFQFYN